MRPSNTEEGVQGHFWPTAIANDAAALQQFLRLARNRCEAMSLQGSVVLSLSRLADDPLTLEELNCSRAVDGFFAADGRQQSYHGDGPYQRAKMITFLWAHMLWAHWHGYVLVVAHSHGALPPSFIDAHESPCTRFVDTGLRINTTGQLFTTRYANALRGMSAHPTRHVVHEDLDSAVTGLPFFLSAAVQPMTPTCPSQPTKDWACACDHASPNLFLKVSGGVYDFSSRDPARTAALARQRVSNDYFQTQLDVCFGAHTHNASTFELWFNGQLGGDSEIVMRVLRDTVKRLKKTPPAMICDMAALTLALQAHGVGSHVRCPRATSTRAPGIMQIRPAYIRQGSTQPTGFGFTAAHQILWVQAIYPAVLLGRAVSERTFPNPLHPSLPARSWTPPSSRRGRCSAGVHSPG